MCGIAGIIYRDGSRDIGREMTAMLQSMKHRGPDSTGYALFGPPSKTVVMRYKLADANDERDYEFAERLDRNRSEVESRLSQLGARVIEVEEETDYALRATIEYDGDLKTLADYVEDVPNCEVLSLGHSLEIIKDLGDAETVCKQYDLDGFDGTHAIGHVRMATESDVDISGAHPYWAYPFADVAVVHNGQLTNYFQWRRRLERSGHRFQSECDSEVIAVYLAEKMSEGLDLEAAMRQSLDELDGVFTYICVTEDALGVAKDEMAAKPLVLYESDDLVALASEEIAIRAIIDHEIDTYDPYEGEVLVWKR
jgi:methylamine---glutamate N-methyltransferase subunit A